MEAPSRPNARAVALPTPDEAPVTTTTDPGAFATCFLYPLLRTGTRTLHGKVGRTASWVPRELTGGFETPSRRWSRRRRRSPIAFLRAAPQPMRRAA